MSESTEMYLVKIALAQEASDTVPLPRLADLLAISHVSTNQMCRRLQDDGLLEYVPYRGVKLTSAGRAIADRVVRRRRLWEVFLVERLGMSAEEAATAACAFEHVTTNGVADRLSAFLGRPRKCPHGRPIPSGDDTGRLVPRRADDPRAAHG